MGLGVGNHFYVWRYTSNWGAVSTVYTSGVLTNAGPYTVWSDNTTLYVAYTTGNAPQSVIIIYTTDHGANWTSATTTGPNTYLVEAVDIFKISTSYYVAVFYQAGAGNYYCRFNRFLATVSNGIATSAVYANMMRGSLSSATLYTIIAGTNPTYVFVDFNGSTVATRSCTVLTGTQSFAPNSSMYFVQANTSYLTQFILKYSSLYYSLDGTNWVSIPAVTANNVIPLYIYNSGLQIQYIIFGSTLYYFSLKGKWTVASYKLSSSPDGVCGWGNYLPINGGYLWGLSLVSIGGAAAQLDLGIMKAGALSITQQTAPLTNGFIAVYDDLGNYWGDYRWMAPIFDGQLWADTLLHPTYFDLQQLITADYTAGTLTDTQIFTDLITGASGVNTILPTWIIAGTISGSATAWQLKFVQEPLWQCLRTLCLLNARVWWINPATMAINYGLAATASGITETTANLNMNIVNYKPITTMRSQISIRGGNSLVSSALYSGNFQPFLDYFPEIIDRSTLDAARVAIATFLNVVVNRYLIQVFSTTFDPIGKKTTYQAPYYILGAISAAYYVIHAVINLISNVGQYSVFDVLTLPEFDTNSGISATTAMELAASALPATSQAADSVKLGTVAAAEFIQRGGSVAFTADQPMGTHKLTGLAAGSANGDAMRYEQVNALIKWIHHIPWATQNSGNPATIGTSFTSYGDHFEDGYTQITDQAGATPAGMTRNIYLYVQHAESNGNAVSWQIIEINNGNAVITNGTLTNRNASNAYRRTDTGIEVTTACSGSTKHWDIQFKIATSGSTYIWGVWFKVIDHY